MVERVIFELPGDRIQSLEEFWLVIGEVVNGPGGYFGANLDAFADCLSGGFGTPESGYTIRWLHADLSRAALGFPETVRQLEKRLATCHPASRPLVAQQLRKAEQGRGPTVFDLLVDLMKQEPSVHLELA